MKTFNVDDRNDIKLTQNGNIELIDGLNAVMLKCAHYAKAARAEMAFKMDKGMPFFTVAFGKQVNAGQYEAAFRARMREIDEVVSVDEFTAKLDDGVLSYTATITTIYGKARLNSELL